MAITKMYWAFISNLIAFRQNRQSVAKKTILFFLFQTLWLNKIRYLLALSSFAGNIFSGIESNWIVTAFQSIQSFHIYWNEFISAASCLFYSLRLWPDRILQYFVCNNYVIRLFTKTPILVLLVFECLVHFWANIFVGIFIPTFV